MDRTRSAAQDVPVSDALAPPPLEVPQAAPAVAAERDVTSTVETPGVQGAEVNEASLAAAGASAARKAQSEAPATELPAYYFNRPPGQKSIFHDRTEGPFLGWLADQGLPADAHDGLIARHMEAAGTTSVLPKDFQRTTPQAPTQTYADIAPRHLTK